MTWLCQSEAWRGIWREAGRNTGTDIIILATLSFLLACKNCFYYLLCRITVSTRGFDILNSDVYLHSVINPPTTDPRKAMCKGIEKQHAKNRDRTFIPQTRTIAQFFSTGKNITPGLSLINDLIPLHLPTSAPLRAFPNGQGLISIIFPLTLSDWTQPWNPRLVPVALISQYTLGAPPT